MKYGKLRYNSNFITIFFSLFIIIFSFSGALLNIQIRNSLEKNTLEILQKDAQIISEEVDSYLCRYGELAVQMLTNDTIVNFVKHNSVQKAVTAHSDYQKVKDTLERIKATSTDISIAWIGMKDINCIITDEGLWIPNFAYDMEKRSWYIDMIKNNRNAAYTQPYVNIKTGKMELSVISPIYSQGRLVGNVGINIDIEKIRSFIESYSIGIKGYPILISDEGTIIYHPSMNSNASVKIRDLGGEIGRVSSSISSGDKGISEYIEDEKEYYLAYSPIKSGGWTIATIVPKSETKAQINLLNIMSAIIFGASTIILVIIAIMFKLSTSFKKLNELYEKLRINEKELKAQFNEIQAYAYKMKNLKQKYDIAIKGTNSGVWEYEVAGGIFYLSEGFKNYLGITQKDELDYNSLIDEFLAKDEQEKLKNELARFINGYKEEIYCQVSITNKYKKQQCMMINGRGIYDENNSLKLVSGIILDITKMREQEKYIEYLAYHDPLTNLPNRIKFIEILEKEIDENQSGAIMLLDLDDFKRINDTLGHVYGDKILKKIAEKLLDIKDDKLLVSRFGGDEFLVLVKRENDICEIESYAKKIIGVFKNDIIIEKDYVHVGCSMGITLYPFDSNNVNKLIMNADIAMYKAKDSAGSSYMFFNNEMTDMLKEKIQMEKYLREALKEDGFTLLYQPQVSAFTGNITGFEALLRLKNHEISPLLFIPVAEETGLIIEIGRWVTKKVVKQLKSWKESGVELKPISINFSGRQLRDLGYIEFLKDLLEREEVSAEYLSIEITESIFLDEKDKIIRFLNALKDLGIKIALDDFGTGYSSISYLTFLPVDIIKLDKTLNDKFLIIENVEVINSIVSLAHSLGLKVIAEGIESVKQYIRLRKVGCDIIQGYLFSKPMEVQYIDKIYDDNLVEKLYKDIE